MESNIPLNYIETANSILHEMPWIEVKEYKVQIYKIVVNFMYVLHNMLYRKLVQISAGMGHNNYVIAMLTKEAMIFNSNWFMDLPVILLELEK